MQEDYTFKASMICVACPCLNIKTKNKKKIEKKKLELGPLEIIHRF